MTINKLISYIFFHQNVEGLGTKEVGFYVNICSIFWGKGGQCVWLTTYHPCSAETSRKSGALNYPEPPGPPRPVAGRLYFTLFAPCN